MMARTTEQADLTIMILAAWLAAASFVSRTTSGVFRNFIVAYVEHLSLAKSPKRVSCVFVQASFRVRTTKQPLGMPTIAILCAFLVAALQSLPLVIFADGGVQCKSL
jgi:hypothetical protein